jgi:ribosomal protein S12 methylthiotransferase
LIKGPYRSRNISSIVEEAHELGCRGVKEINLVSQDTTYFGRDKGRKDDLVRLLRRLIDVPRIRWIRLLYGYPEEITDALLELMKEEKICSYLDIPFQHADRRILKEMKRSMDERRALTLIDKIRKRLPDVALRTSLIVGFPGEGRREFKNLKTFVQTARFDHLGVFTYSPEEGTHSFRTGDPIPESEKLMRQEDIMRIQAEISSAINRKYLNQRLEILMEYPSHAAGKPLFGRARFQAPEVDGVIFIRDDSPASRRLKALGSIPNSVIIKQFSEVGRVTARPRPSSLKTPPAAPFAAGVAGTGAAPPIKVCFHHGIWDAYKPLEKVEIVATDVYDLHGKIVR